MLGVGAAALAVAKDARLRRSGFFLVLGSQAGAVPIAGRPHSAVLVGVPEGLKSDDRVHAITHVAGQTRRVSSRVVGDSITRHPRHLNLKALGDLRNCRACINARMVGGDVSDFETLLFQPRDELVSIGSFCRIITLQLLRRDHLSPCHLCLQSSFGIRRDRQREQDLHGVVIMRHLGRRNAQVPMEGQRRHAVCEDFPGGRRRGGLLGRRGCQHKR